MRKICVFTGTRAEYGLLRLIMKEIQDDPDLELQIIASGAHLSPEFGLTYKEIENDGFFINEKVEMLLSSDTTVGINKSIGLGFISFGEALSRLKPDILVGLGDRFELLAIVTASLISRVPVAHIHGGETTEGAMDEAIRHSITKMSHLHFTSTDEYRNRVIQLGETPDRVFNFGAPAIDNILGLKLLSKDEFESRLGFKLHKKNIIVTFHPVTLENNTAEKQFNELLAAIDELEETGIIFTKPNSDTNGRIIIKMIDDYVNHNSHKAMSSVSLGQLLYLSALQYIDCALGNSSSGLLEVPSFKKATINIGDRQKGRLQGKSIINCTPVKEDISNALKMAYSENFQEMLQNMTSEYGDGKASKRIKEKLKSVSLDHILKKKFYNIGI